MKTKKWQLVIGLLACLTLTAHFLSGGAPVSEFLTLEKGEHVGPQSGGVQCQCYLAARVPHDPAPDRNYGLRVEAYFAFDYAARGRHRIARRQRIPEARGTHVPQRARRGAARPEHRKREARLVAPVPLAPLEVPALGLDALPDLVELPIDQPVRQRPHQFAHTIHAPVAEHQAGSGVTRREMHVLHGELFVLQDAVDDVLLKNPQVAISEQVFLQRLQLQAAAVGHVADGDHAEVRQ